MSKKRTSKLGIIKKGDLYYPGAEFKKNAVANKASIYRKAKADPLKFWEERAEEIVWRKKWTQVFEHNPPNFKWFKGGELNITETCLDENLKRNKDKVAFIWEPEPIGEAPRVFTYEHLSCEVNKFANALKELGIKKGDKVGVYLPMIPEALITMLACARIGAIHTVVFSAFSPAALRARLQDTEAKLLVTADGYFRRGKTIDLKSNADLGVNETKVNKMVVVKRAGNQVNLEQGRDVWWSEVADKQSDFCPACPMAAEDTFFILYTSGSTGKPKGTVQTCGGYAVQAKATAKYIFDLKPDDIFWSTADVGWITGHTYSCYAPLLNCTTFIIFEGAPNWPVPDRWAQTIEKYGVTIFYTAPTAIRMFERFSGDLIKKYKFETLRLLGSVGEPIDEAAWHWYFENIGKKRCPIVDTWWQTETGGILISSLPGIGPFKPSYTGIPFPGLKFEILDNDGKKVKKGKQGNLVLLPPFSPGLLRGVYNNPKRYLKTYWTDFGKEVYYTSDSAYVDKKGMIRIVGRNDDVLKVAGHRFTTGEIESAVALLESVVEAAVIGKKDEMKGEVPVVFVIIKKGGADKEAIQKEVVAKIRKEIGPIALPSEVYVVEDLPKTRSGKIMRRILKKLFTGEELGDLSTLANPEIVEVIRNLIE